MTTLSDVHRDRVRAVLSASPLVPVITLNHPDEALPLCRALVEGGVRVLEITLRTPHGLPAIRQLREALPEVWVGAGTVTGVIVPSRRRVPSLLSRRGSPERSWSLA